jgi:hypothetical protein
MDDYLVNDNDYRLSKYSNGINSEQNVIVVVVSLKNKLYVL